MAEPISSSTASVSVITLALLSLFPGIEAAVVLGAFAGAAMFVLASYTLSTAKKLGFFLISFIAGFLSAPIVTGLIDSMLPRHIEVNRGVGALLAAAVSVKLLLWLIRYADNPLELLDRLRGGDHK